MFTHLYNSDGEILVSYSGAQNILDYQKLGTPPNHFWLDTEFALPPDSYVSLSYSSEKVLKVKPPAPTMQHEWDWTLKIWKLTLEKVLPMVKARITEGFNTENFAPLTYAGALFDADEVAQNNIRDRMASLDSLPIDFTWRDYDNVHHPADADFIRGLHQALVDRKTELYQQAWQHKENSAQIMNPQELLNYQVIFSHM